MNRLFLASFLTVGLSISAFAAVTVPLDQTGSPANPAFSGTHTCLITSSTGTAALLCTTGSGTILQVIGSSVAATDYLTFRDSATANTTSTELGRVSAGNLTGVFIYPRFNNGLSVNASVAPGVVAGAWTIIYRKN